MIVHLCLRTSGPKAISRLAGPDPRWVFSPIIIIIIIIIIFIIIIIIIILTGGSAFQCPLSMCVCVTRVLGSSDPDRTSLLY